MNALDNVKKMGSGFFDKICGYADKPQDPTTRKVTQACFAILLIGAGVALYAVTTASTGLDANPNPMNLMSFMMPVGFGAVGLYMLLNRVVPKQHHRTMYKVLSLTTFLFLFAAGFSFFHFASANSYSVYNLISNPYCQVGGLMMTGGVLYALGSIYGMGHNNRLSVTVNDIELSNH